MTPNPLRVYIAGPFRSDTPLGLRQNIEAARDVGAAVAQAGHTPVIPHTMYADFDRLLPDQFWIDATLDLLSTCPMLVLCPGWRASQGSIGELRRAQADRKPVVEIAGPYSAAGLREAIAIAGPRDSHILVEGAEPWMISFADPDRV